MLACCWLVCVVEYIGLVVSLRYSYQLERWHFQLHKEGVVRVVRDMV